jgi:hypothetical protein
MMLSDSAVGDAVTAKAPRVEAVASLSSSEHPDELEQIADAVQRLETTVRLLSLKVQGQEPSAAPDATVDDDASDSSVNQGLESLDFANATATANTLQQSAELQRKVAYRMAELQHQSQSPKVELDTPVGNKGARSMTSGRARTTRDIVVNDISWPHFYVYRGNSRRAVTYEDLSLPEFVFGFLESVFERAGIPRSILPEMYYLRDIMKDVSENPWETVRNFNGIVFQFLEMDRLGWSDIDKIAELRSMYLHNTRSHNLPTRQSQTYQGSHNNRFVQQNSNPSPVQNSVNLAANGPINFCIPYQKGECNMQSPHDVHGVTVNHI